MIMTYSKTKYSWPHPFLCTYSQNPYPVNVAKNMCAHVYEYIYPCMVWGTILGLLLRLFYELFAVDNEDSWTAKRPIFCV